MTKCGIATLQASSTAMPRQAIFLHIKNDRIPYFDIHNFLFDILRFKNRYQSCKLGCTEVRSEPYVTLNATNCEP